MAIFASRVDACVVCIPFPESTVADALIGAEVVVLARENPNKPFSYSAVEILKGELQAQEIALFIDSATRRRLAQEPDRAVVLVLAGDESTAGSRSRGTGSMAPKTSPTTWRSVGYASPRYEFLVREILARASRWRGKAGTESRAMFFMPYLSDGERPIRELAYLEVGRASYETIRRADRFVSSDQIRRVLADVRYLEWRALYILLLGFDAAPDDKATIRAAMQNSARLNLVTNLSAWAAALIEIDGAKAIGWLEAAYLGASGRDRDAVLEVLKALSVHGSRETSGLRTRIAESYGALIEAHPSLAGWAARDLTAWHDWRFAGVLADLRQSKVTLDSASAYAVDFYIGRARSSVAN